MGSRRDKRTMIWWHSLRAHMQRSLMFNNGHLHATDTRNTKKGRAPDPRNCSSYSVSNRRSLSQGARLLAESQDSAEDAYGRLIEVLAASIKELADENQWKLEGRESAMAMIVLSVPVFRERLTDTEAATMMGIRRQSYQECWKVRIAQIQEVVRQWQQEIES